MRCIGEVARYQDAEQLCDYLLTEGIKATFSAANPADDNDSGIQEIWVHDEDQLKTASEELERFKEEPNNSRYAEAGNKARTIRSEERARNEKIKKLQKKVHNRGPGAPSGATLNETFKRFPTTMILMLISIVATLVTNFGNIGNRGVVERDKLTLADQVYLELSFVDLFDYETTGKDPFASIKKGEIWRLFSNFFLHGGIFHIVFNMIMLYSLGRVLEQIHGSMFLLVLLVSCTISGTMVQILLPPDLGGSAFSIGASGGIYGLFGYLWIRPQVDASYPYRLPQQTIMLMIVFLFLCMTGILGDIANGAHVGGLAAGIAAAQFTGPTRK